MELVLGYTKDELYHKPIIEFQDTPDIERVLKVFQQVFIDGIERTIEYSLITKSGKIIPCLGSGSLAVVDGKDYLIGIAFNISKLKEVEKK